MLPPERPDPIHVASDGHRLVADAGLILPLNLAHHPGMGEPVDHQVDLGRAPGRADVGDKMLTLVASALASGQPVADIDDADALRSAGRLTPLDAWSRRHPRWGPFCGVSSGATSAIGSGQL